MESAVGLNLNDDCFVAVKVGDELKQARFKPDRSYRFGTVDGSKKPKSGRIDLFKQIGSCKIDACTGTQEVKLTSTDKADSGVKLRVNIQNDEKVTSPKGQVREDLTRSAKEYLKGHQVEEMLSEAVKAILKDRPADPRAFIVQYLNQGSESPTILEPPKPPAPEPPVPAPVKQEPVKQVVKQEAPACAPPEEPPTWNKAPTTRQILEAAPPAPKVDPVALDSLRLKVQGGMKAKVASGDFGTALKTAELERSRMKTKNALLKVVNAGGLCSFLQNASKK